MQRTLDQAYIPSISCETKFGDEIAAEFERYSGQRRSTPEEMQRFVAVKGYRDLLERLRLACAGLAGYEALKAAAREMRGYTLERPAVSAATFRTPMIDAPEWREAVGRLRHFMLVILLQCGLNEGRADEALRILRSLLRGFVMHEVTHSFFDPTFDDESFENALDVFIAGLPALQRLGKRKAVLTG